MTDKTPAQRRYARNRDLLITTAREIITQQGLDNFSMRSLAEKADYSPSATYKYFKNKEEILEEISKEGWEILDTLTITQTKLASASGESIYQSAVAWLKFVNEYPNHYFLMFNQTTKSPNPLKEFVQLASFTNLVKEIETGIKRKEIYLPIGSTPMETAFNLIVLLHGLSTLRLTKFAQDTQEFDRLSEKTMRQFVQYLTK
ncbi:MAG: hypothetical protein CVU39_17730 [Chloroflexi bacterium HGW-Chloroflexi-10]|nr:MAG: hypothetical protein CVU39_17730 [Chloroflexi bacterium HGW-Chloroflexi-10]